MPSNPPMSLPPLGEPTYYPSTPHPRTSGSQWRAIMPPKGPVTIAKNPNGVLPVNPAAVQSQNHHQQVAKSQVRLKLEVRRLPPGLTKDEFQNAFGEEWKVGGGNVDWLEYRQGKLRRYIWLGMHARTGLDADNCKPWQST